MDGSTFWVSLVGFLIAAVVIFVGFQAAFSISNRHWAGACYETRLEWNNNQKYSQQNVRCAKRIPFTAAAPTNLQR